MKAGWEVKPLGEVFKTVTGNTPPKSAAHYYGNDVPLVKPPELNDGEVDSANDGLTFSGAEVARVAPEGSVLVSCIGNLGKIGLATRSVAFNQQINAIYPNPTVALSKFVFYQTFSPQFRTQLGSLAAGTTVAIVNKSRFNSIAVPLPPLEEQQRIVAVLDEAFDGLARARAHAESNLQNARDLFESYLGAVFTRDAEDWDVQPISELVEADCTLSYGIVQPGDDVANGLPIVRPTDLGERTIKLDGLKRIGPSKANSYARTTLKGTEILLCVRGSTGVLALAAKELEGANVTRGIVPIRFDPSKIEQRLGYYQFLSKPVQDQIRAGTYGAALMQINIRDLRQLSFSVPPVDQQSGIIVKLDSVADDFDLLVEGCEAKLQDIDDLRQSLLQKAFAGELT